MITTLRSILPVAAPLILICVYLVSAAAGGIFLSRLMEGMAYGVYVAYAISFSIQITRAILVFFPQLNPNRPTFSVMGEVIAVVFGVVSIIEIISLVQASGLHPAVYISASVLMIAGIVIEIMLLREVRHATERELMENPGQLNEIRDFYVKRAELKAFMAEMAEIEMTGASPTPRKQEQEEKQDKEENKSMKVDDDGTITVVGENGKPVKISLSMLMEAYSKNGHGEALEL